AAFVKIKVVHSNILEIFIAIVGWIYFLAWSISFYPQVVSNWLRKSVVGLNFDFLSFNLTGFICYSIFNVGLYWVDSIEADYFAEHPRGVNPVQLNDVIFSLHAVLITFVTIIQAIIYERGDQRVSRLAFGILGVVWLFALISLFVTVGHKITWLTYLYFFSYIKLFITLIKYIPQAYMNYIRQSTDGWSIGNILLDFTGGSFSLFQMFLIAFNNDDWGSIFGDPTKFGLGAFSILFDILFIVQHYCLYRNSSGYVMINDVPEIISDPEDDEE
ncbi:hypothetical protein CAPTEDRAFT_111871, partial [Capitella teleta]|uniref:Cystinosin homolog n=1 Tax=Capitella teleta TaxID=283909 RepID=X1YV68_CAPTE